MKHHLFPFATATLFAVASGVGQWCMSYLLREDRQL